MSADNYLTTSGTLFPSAETLVARLTLSSSPIHTISQQDEMAQEMLSASERALRIVDILCDSASLRKRAKHKDAINDS